MTWRALDLTGPISTRDQLSQRAGLARAEAWFGHFPDRLAIEQTNALGSVADSLGYHAAAVRGAFRSRYRHREPAREMSHAKGLTR